MDAVDSIKKGDAKTLAQILSKPSKAGGDAANNNWINQEIKTEGKKLRTLQGPIRVCGEKVLLALLTRRMLFLVRM